MTHQRKSPVKKMDEIEVKQNLGEKQTVSETTRDTK